MNWGDSIWDSSLKSLGLNGGCSNRDSGQFIPPSWFAIENLKLDVEEWLRVYFVLEFLEFYHFGGVC